MESNNMCKWNPCNDININYNVDDVKIESGEFLVTLNPDVADSKLTAEMSPIMIRFDSFICYQVTKESFREDWWISDRDAAWSFYKSSYSEYIQSMKSKCELFPCDIVHYTFVGASLIVDVITETKANITVTKI